MTSPTPPPLCVRWTIGDARPRSFELLRLSIHCAARLFGPQTRLAVCVNSLPVAEAQARTGDLPTSVDWLPITKADLPAFLRPHLGTEMAEGVGWKLAPLQLCPDRFELSLDNDCILWSAPAVLDQWFASASADRCLIAADISRAFGIFDHLCPPGFQNSGIRGLPPAFDLGAAMQAVLAEQSRRSTCPGPVQLTSELDEQGLQAAALSWIRPALVVPTSDVSICSPFWPRSPELGASGAHFVGMNPPHLPWNYFDRPADVCMDELWNRQRPILYQKAGLAAPPL